MKVLVTGATGFIGARLCKALADSNHDVVALGQIKTRPEIERSEILRAAGIEASEVPVSDKEALAKAAKGCLCAYHLAAAQHEANVPDEYFRNINVQGTRNVLEACIETGVERFVHGSTIGVYGSALDGEISEDSPARADNIYGVTKLEGEKVALGYSDDIGVTSIRISETYGPGDWRLLKLFRAIDSGKFFIIGSGDNIHQLVYVDDLIAGLQLAAKKTGVNGEVITLAGPELLSTRQMCDGIAAVLGKSIPRLHAPIWPFLITAVLMEKTLSPLGIQPPLHRRRLDFFRKSFYFSQSKASALLGFAPTVRIGQGLAETADWYRSQGHL